MERQNSNVSLMSSRGSSGCFSVADSEKQLEALAEILQAQLIEQKLIQNRSALLKTVPQAFLGKDAVTILQTAWTDILKQGEYDDEPTTQATPLTREEALEKGNEIVKHFKMFRHATCETTELKDSDTEYYVLDHNLPSQVHRVKNKHKSYWDKMRLLEANVEVKDRKHMFRVFPQCFIATEAVDACMNLKLVKSRGEAVHLIKKLNQKVHCADHVCNEHEFKDEHLFFRFVPKSQRIPDPGTIDRAVRRRSKSPQRSLLGKIDGEQKVRKGRLRKSQSFDPRSSSTNQEEESTQPRRRRSKSPQKSLLGNSGSEPRQVRKGKLRKSKSMDPNSTTTEGELQGGREHVVERISRDRVRKNRNNSISTTTTSSTMGSSGSNREGNGDKTKKSEPVLNRMTTVETEHLLRPAKVADQQAASSGPKKAGSALMRMTTVETEYLLRPPKEDTDQQAFPKRVNNSRANDVRNRLAALKEQGRGKDTDQKQAAIISPVS